MPVSDSHPVSQRDHLLGSPEALTFSATRPFPFAFQRRARFIWIIFPCAFEFARLLARRIELLHGKAPIRVNLPAQRELIGAAGFNVKIASLQLVALTP